MASKQKIIGRDVAERAVSIFEYEDGGKTFFDLHTDGRIILTPSLARRLAKALYKFAAMKR